MHNKEWCTTSDIIVMMYALPYKECILNQVIQDHDHVLFKNVQNTLVVRLQLWVFLSWPQ